MDETEPLEKDQRPSRMERRKLETRAKLLKAIVKQMSKKGIDGTKLDDITEAADLSRRTFYYHFASKEECLVAAAASAYKKHSLMVKDMNAEGEDSAVILARSTQIVLRKLLAEPVTKILIDRPKLLMQALRDSITQYVSADIQAGINSGRFNPVVTGPTLTTTMMWSLVGLIIDSNEAQPELIEYTNLCLVTLGVNRDEASQIVSDVAEAYALPAT